GSSRWGDQRKTVESVRQRDSSREDGFRQGMKSQMPKAAAASATLNCSMSHRMKRPRKNRVSTRIPIDERLSNQRRFKRPRLSRGLRRAGEAPLDDANQQSVARPTSDPDGKFAILRQFLLVIRGIYDLSPSSALD